MNIICKLRLKTLISVTFTVLLIVMIIKTIFQIEKAESNATSAVSSSLPFAVHRNITDIIDPIVLWWTPFTGERGSLRKCTDVKCYFTQNRELIHHHMTKVLLFYGSQLDIMDLPLPRYIHRYQWALFHEESPKNTAVLSHNLTLQLFNYTATFSRFSNFPLTLQYLKNSAVLTETKYYLPTNTKNRLLPQLALAVYVHSDCSTPLERDAYVLELMKHISIDSYGACIQNKELPPHLRNPITGMDSDEFYHILSQYKFTIAFENAVCEDYITEKLWRALIVGSVPVYMGSPSVKDWLPNNNSAILASDFDSPKELANFLLYLNKDITQYESYLQHKLAREDRKITNENLLNALEKRKWGIDNDFEKGNMVEHFECYICKQVHKQVHQGEWIANTKHYDCPPPVSPLTKQQNKNNWWLDHWHTGLCESKVLHSYILMGKSKYTSEEFYQDVSKLLEKNNC